jgi:hypothetical protein
MHLGSMHLGTFPSVPIWMCADPCGASRPIFFQHGTQSYACLTEPGAIGLAELAVSYDLGFQATLGMSRANQREGTNCKARERDKTKQQFPHVVLLILRGICLLQPRA